MFSVVTIISIFIEIFTAGFLISGALTFFRFFLKDRQLKELFFFLFFFCLFIYVSATLTSQLMYDMGRTLSELILVQRIVTISLVASGFFFWLFAVEKFNLKFGHFFSLLFFILAGIIIFYLLAPGINLTYREEVIEPIIVFPQYYIPYKPFFSVILVVIFIFYLVKGFSSSGGNRILSFFSAASLLLFFLSFSFIFFYLRFENAVYLLLSWIMTLFSVLGLLLGEIIPPDSPEALRPLSFLRTRLLFKLMLVFVLLIVILFEATTLATIEISKTALSKYVRDSYLRGARELVGRIESFEKPPTFGELQKLLSSLQLEKERVGFVVDQQGRLLAHPDEKRAWLRESMIEDKAVGELMRGKEGIVEFKDPELQETVLAAYLPVRKFGWGVVVKEPVRSAYFEMRRLETNSLLFVIAGIILTGLTGIFFARSIEKPIKELTLGTEAVARGELGYRIEITSVDEIGKLAEAFNRMTKDLRDSQERLILSEKLASLGTMAAGMAHEIKNPLVSLRTFTQLLQQKWEDKEFREKFSSIIPHEIERINRIAESLLKFGRPMKPELTKVDVNSLLEEVLLLFESECVKNNVRVTKKFATLPEISGDPGQLSQAFVNLIKNAIEAMHEKGGELIVKTDVGEVVRLGKIRRREGIRKGEEMIWGEEEDLGRPVPVVFIEITDTGEGISEENMKSLFDPFFTTKMTGTGMGLPITLRIIEEHKGSIKVRSRKGKGTTFIITLPQKFS